MGTLSDEIRRATRDNGGMSEQTPGPVSATNTDSERVSIRRAPKLPVFLVIGGGVGAIVAFVLTAAFPTDPLVGFGALFGYFALYTIPAGIVLAAIVALLLDRRSRRTAREVTIEHESVRETPPEPEDSEGDAPHPLS